MDHLSTAELEWLAELETLPVARRAAPTVQQLQTAAILMLIELESSRLEVCLVPSPNPTHERKQRVAVTQNPEWYSRLCREFPRRDRGGYKAKPRTMIKRSHTLKALERMASGDFNGVYAERLDLYVRQYASAHLLEETSNSFISTGDANRQS